MVMGFDKFVTQITNVFLCGDDKKALTYWPFSNLLAESCRAEQVCIVFGQDSRLQNCLCFQGNLFYLRLISDHVFFPMASALAGRLKKRVFHVTKDLCNR